MDYIYIIAGFALLVLGGDFLVRSSVGLSFKLNLSKLIIGMTVVSFATSAPELLVSIQAALSGSPDIAISNVLGSNIANIALVLGLTAIISPLTVDKNFYKMNWPVMMLFSIAITYFLLNDLVLTRIEGAVLLITLIAFIYMMISKARKEKNIIIEDVDDDLKNTSYNKIFLWLAIGAAALYFGSEFLVEGAKNIATKKGISEGVIGATIIAIGTSVPELAASIIAALKGEKAISLGNLIGSNIFNIGSVLGITAMITPIHVADKVILQSNLIWMLCVAAVLIPLVFIPKKFELSRLKGAALFIAYLVFLYLAFVSGSTVI